VPKTYKLLQKLIIFIFFIVMVDLTQQLSEQKRKVDFNTYDMTVKELISMVEDSMINIAPEYQRQFRWEADRQSALVESIFLGIPIPSLFMATNADGTWEVIDGVQRLSSIINFASSIDSAARKTISRPEPLTLKSLSKLTNFNDLSFTDLPMSIQYDFKLKPIKVITLSDKSDSAVRFDLFERLNTGGIKLSDQEIRSCIYRGPFNDFIKTLAQNEDFIKITKKSKNEVNAGIMEELVLRFFAYLYYRDNFVHNVRDFLNEYMNKALSNNFDFVSSERLFKNVFSQLANLEYGIVKTIRGKKTSTVLWEAVTVGAAEAINDGKSTLNLDGFYDWIQDPEFNSLVTGATNSRPRIEGRISYTKTQFMR